MLKINYWYNALYLKLILILSILFTGCSTSRPFSSTSPSPTSSFSPSSSSSKRSDVEPQSQLNQTDQAFLVEIETYARNNGTTFNDVSPTANVKTAKTICENIQANGVSNTFDNYINNVDSDSNISEGNKNVLGYLFGISVKYYCPQYLSDVQNAVKSKVNN